MNFRKVKKLKTYDALCIRLQIADYATSTTIIPEQMNIMIENYKFGRLNLG